MHTSHFLALPNELKIFIFEYLSLEDLAKLARVSHLMKMLSIDNTVLLKKICFIAGSAIEPKDFQNLDIVLWGGYHQLYPEIQNKHPLYPIIQELQAVLVKIDTVGKPFLEFLKDTGAIETVTLNEIQDQFFKQLRRFYQKELSKRKQMGGLALWSLKCKIDHTQARLNQALDNGMITPRFLSTQLMSLLDSIKVAYLTDKSDPASSDFEVTPSYDYLKYLRAIVLNPEWHQLLLSHPSATWLHYLNAATLKTPALILPLLKQKAFQERIEGERSKKSLLLSIMQFKSGANPSDAKIALKIYQYALANYEAAISDALFDIYCCQYPDSLFVILGKFTRSSRLQLMQDNSTESLVAKVSVEGLKK